jgi:prevent-host-death family protein
MGSAKIKSATALRNDLYDTLKEVSEGAKQIITHKQGEPVILLSMSEYDQLLEEKNFLTEAALGLAQIKNDEALPHTEIVKKFEALKKIWNNLDSQNS